MTDAALEPKLDAPPPPRPRGRPLRVAAIGAAAVLLLAAVLGAGLRFGAMTGPGRTLIVRLLDGLKLGPIGRLHLEGLQGDVFTGFRLQRLAIVDAQGVWLDARGLSLRWRPAELLSRRVHAERLQADDLVILRRPVLQAQPKGPQSEAPVSVRVDSLEGRIETRPAFSDVAGDWAIRGGVDYARSGRARGRIVADSRLHHGDGVTLDFSLGPQMRLHLAGDAVEAQGGALAGALGLPSDQPFYVRARADGGTEGGRFSFDARSGQAQPARAEGGWSPGGGAIDGQVSLSASRLTRYFAERIGPSAHIHIDGKRRNDGLFDVSAGLVGADAQAQARGPVDVRRRRTPGLDLQLHVSSLSSWAKFLVVGPTAARGVLSGDLDRFTYKAALAGEKFEQNGFVAARLTGPGQLVHVDHEWRFSLDLAGSGGGGAGVVAGLLGPRPTMKLDGARIADGRFLIKDLHIVGAKAKVDAEGGQDLFGGLSFKGRFNAPSLVGLRPGAHGGIDASWNAGEGRGERAWRIGFDAHGRGFASGYPELDHLLGPTPRLTAEATYQDGAMSFSRAELTGSAAHATAKGVYGKGDALAFDGVWSARGPFDVGPVEIAGEAHGTGRVDGGLHAPRVQLGADLAALDVGQLVLRPAHLTLELEKRADGLDGQIAVAGTTPQGAASAKAGFRMLDHGLDLHDVAADAGGVKLAGALSLRDGQPSTADLTVDAGPGLYLASGRLTGSVKIVGQPQGATASLALEGKDLAVPGFQASLRTLSFKAAGPLDRLPFRVAVDSAQPVPWRLAGDGVIAKAGPGRAISLSASGKVRGTEVRTLQPASIRLDPDGRGLRLEAAVGSGRADLDAQQNGDALALQAKLSAVSLGVFVDDYVGQITGTLGLQGRGAHLSGQMDAAVTGARTRDAEADLALDGRVHAALADTRLHLDASASNAQGLKSQASADLPSVAAAAPFRIAIDRTKPLQGAFSVDGELKPLWDLFGGGERSLSGQITAQGSIAGTLNQPQATGSAAIAKGRFQDGSTGLVLQDLEAQAEFGRDAVAVRRFAGTDGHGGRLSGEGTVSLTREGLSTFQLQLSKFQLINNDLGRATASGPVTVVRDASGKARLNGTLTVDRGDLTTKTPVPTGVVPMDVIELNRPQVQDASAPKPAGAGLVTLDVAIRAPRGVYVKGKGVDAELTLDAHVSGTTAQPQLTGTAHIARGYYDLSGKRFDFDPAGVIHLASKPENIRLDLRAERNDPAIDAIVDIHGTAARPDIQLRSLPVLPQDEILARVLFGVSASQLSGFEAAQLTSSVIGLASGGGLDVLSNLRQFAGLDRLALGGDASGATISGGKYISKSVYLELTGASTGRSQTATTAAQQARTGPSAEVEWRVRRDLSLVSQVWTGGDAQLSVRFRKSY